MHIKSQNLAVLLYTAGHVINARHVWPINYTLPANKTILRIRRIVASTKRYLDGGVGKREVPANHNHIIIENR